MCSTVTYKLLCCFYALCNMYFAYFAGQRAEGLTQLIVPDDCSGERETSSEHRTSEADGSCNVSLLGASVLDCAMSLLMMAAVMLGWSRTVRMYMVYLWIRYLICLGLWWVIWKAFGSSEQMPYMPFSAWCLVLLLFSVYYSLELWIMKGTYDAINLECGLVRERDDAACCPSLCAGGFMA